MEDVVDTFIFWQFYKVEIRRNLRDFMLIITHIPTGFVREMEMDLAQEYIMPLIKIMNAFMKTNDMEEYMRLINDIKEGKQQ